jgi:hypothetical protein
VSSARLFHCRRSILLLDNDVTAVPGDTEGKIFKVLSGLGSDSGFWMSISYRSKVDRLTLTKRDQNAIYVPPKNKHRYLTSVGRKMAAKLPHTMETAMTTPLTISFWLDDVRDSSRSLGP